MKVKFYVLTICLWNFSLILASSSKVVKRSAENPDMGFQGNFDSTTAYFRDYYRPHRPYLVPHRKIQQSPRPHHYPPRYEGYPWRRVEFGPPRNDHHNGQSFEEPTWDQNLWNRPSDTRPPPVGPYPGTDGYTDFDKKTQGSRNKEDLPDCHCKFENVGSRTIFTVSVNTMPTMTTPPTTTSTSTTIMTTTSTTPSTSSIDTTTAFDWNTYVEKELSDEFSKNNSAGIGIIDVRIKESN